MLSRFLFDIKVDINKLKSIDEGGTAKDREIVVP